MATRTLFVDAYLPNGTFKPLQSTNYVLSADFGASGEEISLTKGRLVEHWKDSFTKMVLVYHPPDIFQGYRKEGPEGDASDPRNYDFGPLDEEITRVASIGAVACLQFEDRLHTYQEFASPELFRKIGYVLADRYGNGNGFPYKNMLSLVELYPEPDMYTSHLDKSWYIPYFERIEGFSRGAQQANPNVGVGAVGANRMYYCAGKMPESPFHFEFYKSDTNDWVEPRRSCGSMQVSKKRAGSSRSTRYAHLDYGI
ncbi:hypothetical protein AUP68_08377 [Ilyonectria robusta]